MNDKEIVQQQYEKVKAEVDSWPDSLKLIPSHQDLQIARKLSDMTLKVLNNREAFDQHIKDRKTIKK